MKTQPITHSCLGNTKTQPTNALLFREDTAYNAFLSRRHQDTANNLVWSREDSQ